jgi:hypothetical protein
MPDARDLPEHTCGGTYRRRGRKRKRGGGAASGKPQLSYAERKQKRILKKFGAGGVALGDDEDTRIKLEDGKKPKGKPRVAGSNRGRELRAAAALARFEQVKKEEIKEEENTDSDTEDEYDWPRTDDESAVQRDGKDFVRICEAEDDQDDNVKREMEEMYDLSTIPKAPTSSGPSGNPPPAKWTKPPSKTPVAPHATSTKSRPSASPVAFMENPDTGSEAEPEIAASKPSSTIAKPQSAAENIKQAMICAACSLANEPTALICTTCSNVLKPAQMPNHWRCQSAACRGGSYINVGDYGGCQVCGTAKPSS